MVEDYKKKIRIKSVKKRISNINSVLRISIWTSLGISSAMVLFCAVADISSSHLFHVKNISIKGCSHMQEDEILSLLDIEKGDNILSCDIDMARQRIQEHPWVKDVEIVRRFIPASIIVNIKEQVSVAAVYLGVKGYVVNEEGRIFASMPQGFKGLTIRAMGFIPTSTDMNAFLKKGIEAIHLLQSKGLPVDRIDIEAGGRMIFRLKMGVSVASLETITPAKLDMALCIMRELKPMEGTVLDLSCEDKVVLSNPIKGGVETRGS